MNLLKLGSDANSEVNSWLAWGPASPALGYRGVFRPSIERPDAKDSRIRRNRSPNWRSHRTPRRQNWQRYRDCNLIRAGVDRRTAVKITGHKTEAIFERYNTKITDDMREARIKVQQYKTAAVSTIAERSASR